jgi:drug/metabolite transporter (DMT)-like permease
MNNQAARSDLALFLLCVAIWGSTWIAITFQLGQVEPEASVFYRFLLASILLFAWCRLRGLKLRFGARQHLALALQGTLLFGVSYMFVYHAESLVVSGLVALGFSATPLVNMLGAKLAFGTPMSRRVAFGAVLGTVGILFVFAPEIAAVAGDDRTLRGACYTALAVLTSAAGSLAASRNARIGITVQQAMAWGMLYGSACSLLVILFSGKPLAFEWSVPT